jgi:O-antigen/teichoic acid export membrane protein
MSDRYLLFWILGPEAVGVYSVGYKLGSVALFIIMAFNLGWQPFYIKTGHQENTGVTLGEIGTIFLHLLISLWGLIAFWTPIFMKIKLGENYLIGKQFWASEQIVPIIFFSYLFYGGYIILMPSIYLLEKQNWAPMFRGIGAIINIILNLVFIRYWGMLGAALATLMAYMVMFFSLFIKSNQWIEIMCNWKIIIKHLITTSIFIIIYQITIKTLLISIGFTVIYIGMLFIMRGKTKIIGDFVYLKSLFHST